MRDYLGGETPVFLSPDPLEKKFAYWSPYHFSGDNPIRFVDLDGAEILDPFTKYLLKDAGLTIVQQPTSTKAKAYGILIGFGGAVANTGNGVINLVRHPILSIKGIGHYLAQNDIERLTDYGTNMYNNYGDLPEPVQKYAIGAHVTTDIAFALSPVISKSNALTKIKIYEGVIFEGETTTLIKNAEFNGKISFEKGVLSVEIKYIEKLDISQPEFSTYRNLISKVESMAKEMHAKDIKITGTPFDPKAAETPFVEAGYTIKRTQEYANDFIKVTRTKKL